MQVNFRNDFEQKLEKNYEEISSLIEYTTHTILKLAKFSLTEDFVCWCLTD